MKSHRDMHYSRHFEMDDIFRATGPLAQRKEMLSGYGIVRIAVACAAAVLFIVSLGLARGAVGATVSYFRDDEISTGNLFKAGTLGFNLVGAGNGYTFDGPHDPDGAFESTRPVPNAGSFPMQYVITIDQTGGSGSFCSLLRMISTTSPFIFDGPLMAFSTTTTSIEPLQFEITLPDGTPLNDQDTCLTDVHYRSTSIGATSGYSDSQHHAVTFLYNNPPTDAPQSQGDPSAPPGDTSTTTPPVIDATTPPDMGTSTPPSDNSNVGTSTEQNQTPPTEPVPPVTDPTPAPIDTVVTPPIETPPAQ